MSIVESKLGKELTPDEVKVISKYKVREFGTSPLDEKDNSKYRNHLFFLIKSKKGKILSFGRLVRYVIGFNSKKYDIYGIKTIVSVVRKKGYGKKLVQAMKEFVINTGKTGIGFCGPKLSSFYIKNGLQILKNEAGRFVEEKITSRDDTCEDDVIYQEGKDSLIEEIKKKPKKLIFLPRKRW
jgi:hypothetical protein